MTILPAPCQHISNLFQETWNNKWGNDILLPWSHSKCTKFPSPCSLQLTFFKSFLNLGVPPTKFQVQSRKLLSKAFWCWKWFRLECLIWKTIGVSYWVTCVYFQMFCFVVMFRDMVSFCSLNCLVTQCVVQAIPLLHSP